MTIKKVLGNLSPELEEEMHEFAIISDVPKNTEVMREGQYVKSVPFVSKGLIKVFTRNEDKELLLYYIRPGETCIMSFDACLKNIPSKIYASTEENSTVILLPYEKVMRWMKQYPEINSIFFEQYTLRYNELIQMINELLFEKMDSRLLNYLKTKSGIMRKNPIKISHRKIANDLGTAREVISRIIKKLENEGKIHQLASGIKIN